MVPSSTQPVLDRPLVWFLAAVGRYIQEAFALGIIGTRRTSLLELHKIAYFLQAAGLPLRLGFDKGHYGPYAPAFDRRLAEIEGHYVIGFGDGTGGTGADMKLTHGTAGNVEAQLASDERFQRAWQQISDAATGYNYPDGIELLASVHYLAVQEGGVKEPDAVATNLAAWDERKRRLFPRHQTIDAWKQLQHAGLLTPNR